MSPSGGRAKNRRTEPVEIIEVPGSPSEPDTSLDAGGEPLAIERRETAMSSSGARSDPQRLVYDQRMLEMEAELLRLRNALSTEKLQDSNELKKYMLIRVT